MWDVIVFDLANLKNTNFKRKTRLYRLTPIEVSQFGNHSKGNKKDIVIKKVKKEKKPNPPTHPRNR